MNQNVSLLSRNEFIQLCKNLDDDCDESKYAESDEATSEVDVRSGVVRTGHQFKLITEDTEFVQTAASSFDRTISKSIETKIKDDRVSPDCIHDDILMN